MFACVATIKAKEGKAEEMGAALKALAAVANEKEEGLILYKPYQRKDEPGTFIMMEQYVDEDAFKVHGKYPEFKEAAALVGACIDGAPEAVLLNEV